MGMTITLPLQPQEEARHICEVLLDNTKGISAEELAKLPRDGACEHDHYLYGHAKGRKNSTCER
jgi:hypothetical protein